MTFDRATADQMKANARNWDARTPVHVASEFYTSKDGSYWFAPCEWDDLGPLDGRDVVHLQSHLGTETVEFARRGARAVGLDFSAESVRAAREIAAGTDVEYVQANVYDAVTALNRKFDIVYTGKGALCYLPDMPRWARVIADLLRPGGFVYIVEFHPLLNSLGTLPNSGPELVLANDYLAGRGVEERDATWTYTDGPALTGDAVSYEWRHGIGETVTSLVGAGLRIDLLREIEELPWRRFDDMVATEYGWWRLPDSRPRIPLLFAVKASLPGE